MPQNLNRRKQRQQSRTTDWMDSQLAFPFASFAAFCYFFYPLTSSPPPTGPRPRHAVKLMESVKNRTEPSQSEAFTPLGCRLRAVLTREVLLPATQGILGSVLGI